MPLTRTRMPSTSLQLPRRPDLDLDLFGAGDVADLDRSVDLESLVFAQPSAGEVDLTDARLAQVSITQAQVASLIAARAEWHDVEISGRFGSIDGDGARLRCVRFVDCKLGYVNLRGAELLDVTFSNCLIEELDLLQSSLRRVQLDSTEVGTLTVRQAKLRDVDLRGGRFESIEGLMELGGATISAEQAVEFAPAFATELGIRIQG
ncbi:pentapeptide repeat-containing protein [Nocardioides sp.]|uniref:pentapeptide repeat-containing protein n=1 Tax=Nocardioides sp. TaxID=35761 RepID=UPI00260F9C2B|nr:pentapeptide repeat-containing protein [Nocardioides sp.]